MCVCVMCIDDFRAGLEQDVLNALDNSSHVGVLTRLQLFPHLCATLLYVYEGATAPVYTEL